MSYKVIERETQALLANGALKRLSTDELLEHQTQLRGRVVVITGKYFAPLPPFVRPDDGWYE